MALNSQTEAAASAQSTLTSKSQPREVLKARKQAWAAGQQHALAQHLLREWDFTVAHPWASAEAAETIISAGLRAELLERLHGETFPGAAGLRDRVVALLPEASIATGEAEK